MEEKKENVLEDYLDLNHPMFLALPVHGAPVV